MVEYLTLSLSSGGDVKIKLRPDLAPGHVARIVELANEGFYDGVKFHRVIDEFVVQGGDPYSRDLPAGDRRIGTGGPGWHTATTCGRGPIWRRQSRMWSM